MQFHASNMFYNMGTLLTHGRSRGIALSTKHLYIFIKTRCHKDGESLLQILSRGAHEDVTWPSNLKDLIIRFSKLIYIHSYSLVSRVYKKLKLRLLYIV